MLFAPHQNGWGWIGRAFYVQLPAQPYPYYSPYYGQSLQGFRNPSYTPDWCRAWHWFPVFWLENGNPILGANFAGQTVFVAVLAAVLVNIQWRHSRGKKS